MCSEYIKLFGSKIQIIREPLTDEDGGVLFGLSDFEKNIIRINSTLPGDAQNSTLTHEIIHLISDSLGIDLDERAVQGLESGLSACGVKIKTKKTRVKKNV